MRAPAGIAALVVALTALPAPPVSASASGLADQPVCGGALAVYGCQAEIAAAGHGSPIGWGPADLRAAYDLPRSTPRLGTIALIDVGPYPTLSDDLSAYRTQYGLGACTTANGCLRQVDYQGGPALPAPVTPTDKTVSQALGVETAADVDMASAICPGCRLLEVQVPLGLAPQDPHQASDYEGYAAAFATAVHTAVEQGADAVSLSFTMPGDAAMLTGPTAAALDDPGVAITAASGDYGFNGDGNSLLALGALPDFTGSADTWPQALPFVTSVGGTTMVEQGGVHVQGAWSETGSGCTTGASPAQGQPSSVAALCGGARASTDVSAVADDIAMYDSYRPSDNADVGWLVMSGTSLASPQIAAMYAAGGHLGAVHGPNTLYRAPRTAFSDVTSGSNASIDGGSDGSCVAAWQVAQGLTPTPFPNRLCQAQPGWDGPTGLGTPRGLTAF
jgi:subtilase family serine protease